MDFFQKTEYFGSKHDAEHLCKKRDCPAKKCADGHAGMLK